MSHPESQQQPSLASSQAALPSLASSFRTLSDLSTRPRPVNDMSIYSAVYSGVDVFEMEVYGVSVMKRIHDSWLNATQILKVAGVDKGRRTKILEKEIQTGEHEKVQGGYGKYQGTWIRFERGLEVCRQYNVEHILRPLLHHADDGSPDTHTPTKEQAMAAQRKRMYAAGNDSRANNSSPSGTFFKNISSTASHAVAAISKARFDSSSTRIRQAGRAGSVPSIGPPVPSFHRQGSSHTAPAAIQDRSHQSSQFSTQHSSQHASQHLPSASQQSPRFPSDYGVGLGPAMDPSRSLHRSGNQSIRQSISHSMADGGGAEPPRKRPRLGVAAPTTPSARAESYGFGQSLADMYPFTIPGSPTEANDSFVYSQQQPLASQSLASQPLSKDELGHSDGAGPSSGQPDTTAPLPYDVSPDAARMRSLLMRLFMADSDQDLHQVLRSVRPDDLDMPIDALHHTALHWAATLSRMPLLRELVLAGADPWRANASGETALMRACVVTNSRELGTFSDILDVLGCTIEAQDSKGRTVLHHIAVTSAVKGRNAASKYYLESLLEWVVRQGSLSHSQPAAPNADWPLCATTAATDAIKGTDAINGTNAIKATNAAADPGASSAIGTDDSAKLVFPPVTDGMEVEQGSSLKPHHGSGLLPAQMPPMPVVPSVAPKSPAPKMGIARFMSEIVNAQDNSGDTALNIAARIGNRSIIFQLLEVGADPNIANRSGLRPVDFGIGSEPGDEAGSSSHGGQTNDYPGSAKDRPDPDRADTLTGPGHDIVGIDEFTCLAMRQANQQSRQCEQSTDDVVTSITLLLQENNISFRDEIKKKQAAVDNVHASLRTTSNQLVEARRTLQTMQATVRKQQLVRQKVANLTQALNDKKDQLPPQPEQVPPATPVAPTPSSGPPVSSTSAWETELSALLETADGGFGVGVGAMLPSAAVLRARIRAVTAQSEMTSKMVAAMRSRSRDVEVKYRRIVALCTRVPEHQVDAVVDGLIKAVESEKEELDLGRLRRFLGTVDSTT